MSDQPYQTLLGADVSYPEDRWHAYIKLFSHAWNFGRVDLVVLVIEWILYLIFTAFITVRAANLVKWDFAYISIPFYVAVVLGCMRTAFWYDLFHTSCTLLRTKADGKCRLNPVLGCCVSNSGKRSKCGLGSRAFFAVAIIVTYIFLILRLEAFVTWTWHLIFAPLYGTTPNPPTPLTSKYFPC